MMPTLTTGNLYHHITITIRTPILIRVRQMIGIWVMKLGALIFGFGGLEVVGLEDDDNAALDAAGGTDAL